MLRAAQTLLLSLFFLNNASAQLSASTEDFGPPPTSRILDHDNVFRGAPDKLAEASDVLRQIKTDHDFDTYLVIFSGMIGKSARSLGTDYHNAWLGPENEGIVLILDIQNPDNGELGRSDKLYSGHYFEKGLRPRIMLADLMDTIRKATSETKSGQPVPEYLLAFTNNLEQRLGSKLETTRKVTPAREHLNLMGIMALALLTIGILVALISKLLGQSDAKSARTYTFPDTLVGERLQAPNGGGKISWTDYGSPSGP